MKKINDDELHFVVKHYKENRLNADAAWIKLKLKTGNKQTRTLWKSVSVAASVLLIASIAIACIVIGYNHYKSIPQQPNNQIIPVADTLYITENTDSIKVFKFNGESIGKVLKELSTYYGKNLSTADSTKVLSGEIEATSCEDAVSIIEGTLDIKIVVK